MTNKPTSHWCRYWLETSTHVFSFVSSICVVDTWPNITDGNLAGTDNFLHSVIILDIIFTHDFIFSIFCGTIIRANMDGAIREQILIKHSEDFIGFSSPQDFTSCGLLLLMSQMVESPVRRAGILVNTDWLGALCVGTWVMYQQNDWTQGPIWKYW